jgi:hypothetical protein
MSRQRRLNVASYSRSAKEAFVEKLEHLLPYNAGPPPAWNPAGE